METGRRHKRTRLSKLNVQSLFLEDPARDTLRLARGTEPQVRLQIDGDSPRLNATDVAKIAADLEAPLSALALETSFLALIAPEAQRVIGRITANVATLEHIVEEISDIAAIQEDRLILHRRTYELQSLLGEAIDRAVGPRGRARIFMESSSACLASVDARRLERVITTLVDRALRATPDEASVVIRLLATEEAVWIHVIDGRRDAVDEARAFDAAYAGIGMYVCKRVVEAHGGTVRLDALEGTGVRVCIELPTRNCSERSRALEGIHVLVVEDDPRQLEALTQLLNRERLVVTAAGCGSTAVVAAHTLPIDVAVIDAQLQDVDGNELVLQILNHRPALPIIIVSGHPYDSSRVVDMIETCGGTYLSKPVDVDMLLDAIVRCVDPPSSATR